MQTLSATADKLASTTAGDGTKLVYRLIKGSSKGRCALVHSLAMNGDFWDRVTPYLETSADVLVYDCRGHGRSDKPKGSQPIERHADDLADLLDAVGWKQAVVAGASMGGCIALAFAARYPERLSGLGLIDTTAWYGPKAPEQWEERGQKGFRDGMASLVDFQKTRWVTDRFREQNPQVVDEAIAVFLANDPEAYLETCRMLGAADMRKLPHFAFPTRIVVGSEDYATPVAMAEATRDLIPGATLTVLEGVRHLTPLECPDLIAAELKALLTPSDSSRKAVQ
ncbi:MAG TPA: alpha/beta hydrolase [Pseudolabrys sp.]|jgi:3-oxoadipate enol-lactonase